MHPKDVEDYEDDTYFIEEENMTYEDFILIEDELASDEERTP